VAPVKAPRTWTEQFALEQRRHHGGAVDGDEAAGPPRPLLVQRVRDQLLAGARLAGDEDGADVRRQPRISENTSCIAALRPSMPWNSSSRATRLSILSSRRRRAAASRTS
jgi:hypothetical protein